MLTARKEQVSDKDRQIRGMNVSASENGPYAEELSASCPKVWPCGDIIICQPQLCIHLTLPMDITINTEARNAANVKHRVPKDSSKQTSTVIMIKY